MKEDGIEPDDFCYSSAINCCAADGRWEEACELIETMKRGGPKSRPNKVAYTAAISESMNRLALLQCKSVPACDWYTNIQRNRLSGFDCNRLTAFPILLTLFVATILFSLNSPGACGRAGQGSKALELFQNMRDDGLAADRVAYNALFSALRVSKDADRVSHS